MIPAGRTRVTFNVSIIDDNTLESNETFVLIINPDSLPNKISATDPKRTNIIILDNDG